MKLILMMFVGFAAVKTKILKSEDSRVLSKLALFVIGPSAIISAFLLELEKAGYYAGLYMSAYSLEHCTTDYIRQRFTVWVANYGVQKPTYSGAYGMWQKSNTGSVAGIAGNTDLDECYMDYPKIIRDSGKNGLAKPSEPQKKSLKVTVELDDHLYSGLLEEQ